MSITEAKRKAKQLQVPSMEEDPAERKRILNVLAQRRYRRRKKEHVQKLEKSAAEKDALSTTPESEQTPFSTPPYAASQFDDSALNIFDDNFYIDPTTSSGYFAMPIGASSSEEAYIEPACLESGTLAAFDASFSFPLPSLPSSPPMSDSTTSSTNAMNSSISRLSLSESNTELSRDEIHLPMLELNLLRGALAIAKRLQVDSLIWSLDSISPFYNSFESLSYDHLPVNLRPTRVQLRNPHHPIFDILPWPEVRNKLILVFSHPPELRPPNARSPMAMVEFVYDMEDSAEGIRIWGDDPYCDRNWEVGKKLFTNWWWALNSDVVNRANEIRRNRGASLLGVERNIHEVD